MDWVGLTFEIERSHSALSWILPGTRMEPGKETKSKEHQCVDDADGDSYR